MRFLLFLFIAFSFLDAHSLKLFAQKDGEFLHVRAYFNSKSPCKECDVKVDTHRGKTFSYKTDQKGNIKIPLKINPIKVVVDASLGHKSTLELSLNLEDKKTFTLPFWIRIILSLAFIFGFFILLKALKKK
ncbi:MAG: hypothetical protein CR967_01640 [Proteobacteria bacterium]|nr:MAG: hypothetical protein CR967_01640 [Pseudomonadota bacterium]